MNSRLLATPREIRDLIYEYALVRGFILVERAAATVPEADAKRCPEFYSQLARSYPLTRTRNHRRVWSVPRFDIGMPSFKGDPEDPPSHVRMTYQLARPCNLPFQDRIEINLLQTCQQIYHEARKVFYSKNVFGFKTTECVPTAFAFLCDRPADSLRLISSMELTLGEGTNLRGTAEAHYPVVPRSTDSLVLRYAYNHFTDLCTLLSTSRMRLRKLSLIIDGLHQFYRPVIPSPADSMLWEAQRMASPRPWVASWIHPLLKLDNLECLEVHWILDRPEICRMADTLSLMRRQMLVRTGYEQHGYSDILRKPKFDFRVSFRIHYQVVTQERTSICCELSRNDLLLCDHEDDHGPTKKLHSSEERLTKAWRPHIRNIFKASGCL